MCRLFTLFIKVLSNKDKLDRWVIVTHESDNDTIQLCIDNDIEYVCSKKIFKNAKFAKGKAINEGLNILERNDWILHLDVDQKLPKNFRKLICQQNLIKNNLYGAYRYAEWGQKYPPTKLVLKKVKTVMEESKKKFICQSVIFNYGTHL